MNQKILNSDLRKKIIKMIFQAKEGHIPSSFSIIDIVNFLYAEVLRVDPKNPKWDERDYFILSKGHGCAALYAVLNKYRFLTDEELNSYSTQKGILGGHPDRTKVPGVEASTGSLGHGFPTAAGIALGIKIKNRSNRVFALLGDGECNEGTIWETALVASKQKLSNLTAIVDANGSADQILPVEPLAGKWKSFDWEVSEIDGHNAAQIKTAFQWADQLKSEKPKVIIAHTIKGKGVSFMEGHGLWHHKIPSEEELVLAEKELK